MERIFSAYLQAGLYGTVILALVILARVLLKKASRRMALLLWIPVAVRLLLPFQLESRLSLQPQVAQLPAAQVQQVQQSQTVAPAVPDAQPQEAPKVDIALFASGAWAGGVALCALYTVGSYLALRLRLRDSIPAEDGARESYSIGGAFLLGYFRPRIYLPMGLEGQHRQMILAHERAHIARGDHWWKLLGFLCVCLHWYNPLVWLGYSLFCRDIEAACDEQVVCNMDGEERKAYSLALLDSGMRQSRLSACPVAFGELSVKSRIKQVLAYRKPAVWLGVTTVVAVAVLGVFFLTSPQAQALIPEQPQLAQKPETPAPEQIQEPEQTDEPEQTQQVQPPVVEDTPDEETPVVESIPQEEPEPEIPSVDDTPVQDSPGSIADMIQSTRQSVLNWVVSSDGTVNTTPSNLTIGQKYPGHDWVYVGQIFGGLSENGAACYKCNHCGLYIEYQVLQYNSKTGEHEYIDIVI